MPVSAFADQLYFVATESIRFLWMPLFIWTALGGAFLAVSNLTPNTRPLLKYQTATALLWSLPIGIVLATIFPLSIAAPESLQFAAAAPAVAAQPDGMIAGEGGGAISVAWSIKHGLGLLTLLLCGAAVWKLASLLDEATRIVRTGHTLAGRSLAAVDADADRLREQWRIASAVKVVFSTDDRIPMTFGWRRPVIVLPCRLEDDPEALHMTLVHELSHIRHRDYLRRLGEQIVSCVFFFHPFITKLVYRIEQYREMACDNDVLQQNGISARRYAALLLEYARPAPFKANLAINMADAETNLKQRIKAMKEYRFFSPGALNSTTIGLALAGLLLAISAMMVACEVRFVEDNSVTIIEAPESQGSAATAAPQTESDGEVFMIVENMPELIGGLASIQQNIKYPDIAMKAGIEGRVFVQFVVDENGEVQEPVVVRGIGGGCDEEAVRAVSLAKFRPGRQKGQAVKVKMSIPITFKLSDNAAASESEIMREKVRRDIARKIEELKIKAEALDAQDAQEEAKKLRELIAIYKRELEPSHVD